MNPERTPTPALILVRREVMLLARNPRLFGLMSSIATLLAVAALFILAVSDKGNGHMAGFARSTFRAQFFLLYFAALIVLPAMAATAVVHERKQDSYALIYTSLIPPGWIVWSKLIALLGLYGGLFAGVLPFTGIIYFFAGVEPLALIQGILVCFSLALGTASIGLLASASAKDHLRAHYHTCVGVVLMLVLPWLTQIVLQLLDQPRWPWLERIGPTSAYNVVYSGMPDWRSPLAFAAYQIFIAIIALTLARRRILPRRHDERVGMLSAVKGVVRWRRAHRFVPISDGQNPIAIKDYRASDFSKGLGPWLLGALGLVVGSLGYSMTHSFPGLGAPLLEFYLFILILPPLMTSLMLKEREENMFGSLGVTLLTAKDIARGKITAALRVLKPLIAGLIIGRILAYCAFVLWVALWDGSIEPIGELNPFPLLLSLLEVFFCLLVLPRLALIGATAYPSAVAAIVASYGSVFVFWALISIMSMMVAFPFVLDVGGGSEVLFFLTQRVAKYIFLIIAARIAMESATGRIVRNMRAG